MNRFFIIIILLFSIQVIAQETKLADASPKSESVEKGQFDIKAGGVVMKKGAGAPVLLFDLRTKKTDLAETTKKIGQFMSIYVEVLCPTNNLSAIDIAINAIKCGQGKAVLALASNGEDAPALIAYPEDHIAIINVDRYAKNATPEVENLRISKEIWRAIALALGGYASDHPCALKAVNSLEDLDNECLTMTCPPVNFKVADNAKKLGIAPLLHAPYFVACLQGWAPAPTNDIQKAVWEKVMSRKAKKEATAKEVAKAPESKPAEAAAK